MQPFATLSRGAIAAAVCLSLLAAGGCGRQRDPDPVPERIATEDWRIEPGKRVGAFTRNGSEADLVRAYGDANVRESTIQLGEGETAVGTMLYPEDPQRRLEVIWRDAVSKRMPERVVLRGERSRWMLPRSISLGTSLRELEERNGRPFQLAGFGWDYAGVVTSWLGGDLEAELAPGVKLYLDPRPEDRAGPQYGSVLGDRDYPSSIPAMRALNPRIYQIFVDLGQEGERAGTQTPDSADGGQE